MQRTILVMAATAMLAACQQPARDVTVDKPWVRLAAVSTNPSAAYFTVRGGPRDETLTGVSTASAVRSEMHESMNHGGTMAMMPIKLVAVRAGGTVDFAPGGKHVMLFGLKAKPGDTVPLTFAFASGRTMVTQAKVVGPADDAPTP